MVGGSDLVCTPRQRLPAQRPQTSRRRGRRRSGRCMTTARYRRRKPILSKRACVECHRCLPPPPRLSKPERERLYYRHQRAPCQAVPSRRREKNAQKVLPRRRQERIRVLTMNECSDAGLTMVHGGIDFLAPLGGPYRSPAADLFCMATRATNAARAKELAMN